MPNLLRRAWATLDVDSEDIRLLLAQRIGGPGQYSGMPEDWHRIHLPLADETCRVRLRFQGNLLSSIEQGPSFDRQQWEQIAHEVENDLAMGPMGIARNVAFSGFQVDGYWRGPRSGVQIRPVPRHSPQAPQQIAEHPFLLECPVRQTQIWQINNARRWREHRTLALLLNVLLRGRINVEPRQTQHVWAFVNRFGAKIRCRYVQRGYFSRFGKMVLSRQSRPRCDPLEVIETGAYYDRRAGHDGGALRVPDDLDESIMRYRALAKENRQRFDRALFWLDLAAEQWTISMSASFASLVSAIESLLTRGEIHQVHCAQCGRVTEHDASGPTAQFRDFFETYAPGQSMRSRRNKMYRLRSQISHGGQLIALDEGRAHGWDPPWHEQRELHDELWALTKVALRRWLMAPPPLAEGR